VEHRILSNFGKAVAPVGIHIVKPSARRTLRLGQSQLAIGFAAGGEPGSRLSRKLAMRVSGDTLLRMIRVAEFKPPPVGGRGPSQERQRLREIDARHWVQFQKRAADWEERTRILSFVAEL
jgi:hypothetical protein